MKGTPEFIMCGNSDRALRALREAGAARDGGGRAPRSGDPPRSSPQLSGWPTIPQVFVKGELVGGADIVEELAETGELEQRLSSALGPEYREQAEERVVSVV